MLKNIEKNFTLISPPKTIEEFINENKNTIKVLNAIKPQLNKYFPNTEFTLEICDTLGWTTETKLLLNVIVSEEMFFNGMLDYFNNIYKEIEPIIENIENTVVLFPQIKNKSFNRMNNSSALNLIARTAYFNNYNNGIIQREVNFRDIPKQQQIEEIKQYCEKHETPNISDMIYDLQLTLFEVDDVITELEEKGINLNVVY